jgi:hypothetical protein
MSFSPTSISNLSVWLDAADSNTITFDTGVDIEKWATKSSFGNADMEQPLPGEQPTYVSNVQNGLPAVRFTTAQWMESGGSITLSPAQTWFVSVRPLDSGNVFYMSHGIETGAFGYGSYLWGSNADFAALVRSGGSRGIQDVVSGGASPFTVGSWQIASFVVRNTSAVASNDIYWNINGTTRSTAFNATGSGVLSGSISRRLILNDLNYPSSNEVGEILIYDRALTTSEVAQVQNYLGFKWGLYDLMTPGILVNGVTPQIATTTSLNLYKYEPFSYIYSGVGGQTVVLVSATTLIRSLVNQVGNEVHFQTASGYSGSASTAESIVLQTSPAGTTYTINVSLSPGRFTAPVLTSITLNKNTSVVTTYGSAIVFTSPIAIAPPTITPALPFGLSFVPIDSKNYALTGTPVAVSPTTSYTVYGFGLANPSQVVTKVFTITVAGEVLTLSIDGTSNLPALTIGTPIPDRSITAVYPLSGPSNLYYTWSNLPDGTFFTDYLGNPKTSPFYPVDGNSTITLVGNPTLTAAQSFVAAGSSNRTVRVRATRVAPSALTADICLGFTFGPTVLFTSSSNIALYSGDTIDFGQAVITANTFFDPANTQMALIAAYTLPAGVGLSYTPGSSNAYLTGTPTVAGSNVYTFTADNSNGVTRDASINIVVSNDVVTFKASSPVNDVCYNFVISRPLTQGLTGYYPSNFLYSATAASTLTDISYSITNVPSGLTVSATSSGLTLTGIPNAVTSLTSSTITALSIHTGATATRTLKWAVLNDDISITSPTSTLTFFQNQAITPIQFAGTTLSERIITAWTSANLPAGLSLSTSGRLIGTPTGFTIGTSTFDVTASTGFVTESNPFTYQIIKDDVLIALVKDPTTASEQFSDVQIRVITYSGLTGTANVTALSPLQPSPATVSVSGNSLSGDFTQVDALLPQYRFRLAATVGGVVGTIEPFIVTATNPDTQRRFVLDVSSTTGIVTPPPTFVFPKGVLTLYSNAGSIYSFTGPSTVTCNSPSNWGVAFSTSNSVYGNIGDIAQSGNTVVLVNSSNLYRSADGGAQWSLVSDISTIPGIVGGYQNVPPFGIFTTAGPILTTVTSGGGSNWLALGVGFDSNVSGAARTILRTSTDDGLTWTDASLSPAFVENSTNSRLYYNQNRYFLAQSNTTSTTYRANASNLSVWTGASSGMPNFTGNIARAFEFSNSTVLAGGDGTPPLYKSSDNGTSWMPVAVGAATSVSDIRHRGGKWYLATDAGIYTSTDAMTFTLADATVARGIDFDGASFNAVYPATPPAAAILTIPYDTSMGVSPFSGATNMNTRETKRMMTRIIDNGPGFLQISSTTTPSTFVLPNKPAYTFLQYARVNIPVQITPTSNFVYYYAADLPRGLQLELDASGISADISGIPSQYSAGFTPFFIFAKDPIDAKLTTLAIDARVISPFVMKKQSGAAAYTAFLRQYVTVNGAQSSRDSVVLPTSNYGIGEFMRPGAPMVETDSNCPC